jgi:hypothetical protein
MKSSVWPLISPVAIWIGRHSLTTTGLMRAFTARCRIMARSLIPSAREMPTQGSVAISSRNVSGVGFPQAGFTEP